MRRETVARCTANNTQQLTGTGWFKIHGFGKGAKSSHVPFFAVSPFFAEDGHRQGAFPLPAAAQSGMITGSC
jgi:hypothetical protein